MAKLTFLPFLAIFVARATSEVGATNKDLSNGMEMVTRAYDAVCWYENLKVFPDTDTKQYLQCMRAAKLKQEMIENPSAGNKKYLETPGNDVKFYGEQIGKDPLEKIPSEYKKHCKTLTDDPTATPANDESDALNDSNYGDYAFKALAHCLLHTLRTKHGDKAIEAVKNERTHEQIDWQQTLLNRENEFRARHGSPPLKLNAELSKAAQKHADGNAAKCKMEHSDNKDPVRQWNGKGTGESLSVSGGPDDNRIAAYMAADGWYQEYKDYSFAKAGPKGGNAVGHFTQSVWKSSEYVGYGYAYNPKCDKTRYVAARYSPAGNMQRDYEKNVLPPKN